MRSELQTGKEYMKLLGVIGGLGPMATVYFLQLITGLTHAVIDQEHLEILVHSKPQIPDRTKYILGQSKENPLPGMIEVGKGLASQGAQIIAIPCITAHFFHKELEDGIGIPVLNAIEETAAYLKNRGIMRAGIMATAGTIESGLFQNTFSEYGIQAIKPDPSDQSKVMEIIYDQVKAGKPVNMELFTEISDHLRNKGAQILLLACTELSLIKRDHDLSEDYLDVMEVLAERAVSLCKQS